MPPLHLSVLSIPLVIHFSSGVERMRLMDSPGGMSRLFPSSGEGMSQKQTSVIGSRICPGGHPVALKVMKSA